MKHARQSGNALFIIIVAVALFAGLGYAFTQNSRGNLGFIETEKTKASATSNAAYTQAVNMAVKRLKLRGCTDAQISHETPNGNNENPDAPTDERCHIFRIAGGGVQYSGIDVAVDPCTTGAIGTACGDGTIYFGTSGGNRLYAAASNPDASVDWGGDGYSVATGLSDGEANTDLLVSGPAGNTYPPAIACRSLGPEWYLGSKDEMFLLWTNSAANGGAIDLTTIGIDVAGGDWYWTSSQENSTQAWRQRFSTGSQSSNNKTSGYRYHCIRSD